MKKFFVIFTVFFLAFFLTNCEENESEPLITLSKEVQDFLNSKEFEKNKTFLDSYGLICKENIKVVNLLEEEQVVGYYLTVPITQNKDTLAYLQVLPSEVINMLPNGDMYAMNLMVLSDWDNKQITGTVMMYDLNFDQFWHATAEVVYNQVIGVIFNSVPKETEKRYPEFFTSETKGDPCGSSRSFFQCYRCVKANYIEADPGMNFFCDIPGISSYCWAGASIWCAKEMLSQ